MYEVLLSLGFNVRISIARVLNNMNIDKPRTHRITILTFEEEEYLIDVGFGAMTPFIPLKIFEKEKITKSYKITQDKNDNFTLELLRKKGFFKLYSFNLDIYTEADCKIGNFYSECHSDAVFKNNLVISIKKDDITFSFRNNSYHQISDTFTNILNIIEPMELKNMLKKDFGVKINKKESKILFEKAEQFRLR